MATEIGFISGASGTGPVVSVSAVNPVPVTGNLTIGNATISGNVTVTQPTASALNGTMVIVGSTASDGSGNITSGGTAQNLFAGATPTNGYAIYNPDPTNDLWVCESTTAIANGSGSIRVSSNGGAYETPPGYKPFHAISIVGAVTAQKFTARKW